MYGLTNCNRFLDPDGDGEISYEELRKGMKEIKTIDKETKSAGGKQALNVVRPLPMQGNEKKQVEFKFFDALSSRILAHMYLRTRPGLEDEIAARWGTYPLHA